MSSMPGALRIFNAVITSANSTAMKAIVNLGLFGYHCLS